MSIFVKNLKQSGYLDQIDLTLCIVGSRQVQEFIDADYSHQGWEIFAPSLTIYGFDADEKACQDRNQQLAQKKINWIENHIPLAVWNTSGTQTLYQTKHPECSSLYPPNELVINRLDEYAERHKLMSTTAVKTITLDEFFQDKPTGIDFLQLDVQGGELNVLEGCSQLLEHQILMILVEVSFIELYKNQPLFAEVDIYLRNQGFTLLDFGKRWNGRRQGISLMSRQHPGQLVWTDGFYVRDLIRPDQNLGFKTPDNILKLACIADIFMFYDYALELLGYLTFNYGDNHQYNLTDVIIKSIQAHPEIKNLNIESIPFISKLLKKSHPSSLT